MGKKTHCVITYKINNIYRVMDSKLNFPSCAYLPPLLWPYHYLPAATVGHCSLGGPQETSGELCEVNSWRAEDVASECTPEHKVGYFPNSFGNVQLPIMFAAINCDLNSTVALTNGAVTCIYGLINLKEAEPQKKALSKYLSEYSNPTSEHPSVD